MIGYGVRSLERFQGRARELAPEAWRAVALLGAGAIFGKWIIPLHQNDVALYARYVRAFLQTGQLPPEYPPLATIPMLATLFPGHIGIGLALLMGLLLLGVWLLLRLYAGYGAAWRFLLWTTPLAILALTRYDLAPVFFATAGLIALTRGRFTLAHFLLAVGALLKVYPLALVPIAFVLHVRRDGLRHALAAVALGWAGPLALVLLLIARQPEQATTWLRIMEHRPIQLESIPASLSWIASLFGLASAHSGVKYHAYSYTSALDAVTGPILLLLRLAGLAWLYLRIPSRKPAQLATAVVALLMVTNQSLSPQYLLWLIPLAALAALPRLYQVALSAAVILTALVYPVLYYVDLGELEALRYPTPLLSVIALRNLALVALAVGLVVAPNGLPARFACAWRARISFMLASLESYARLALIRALQAGNGWRPGQSQARSGRRVEAIDGQVAQWGATADEKESRSRSRATC